MSEQFQMSDRFQMVLAGSQKAELLRYCKMENVPLGVLLHVDKPRSTVMLRLKSAAFHLLQWIDKRLNVMIDRLSTEVEPGGLVQRRPA